jgi:hypothetical protein
MRLINALHIFLQRGLTMISPQFLLDQALEERLEHLESLHHRAAKRYQQDVAEGSFLLAQDYAERACIHQLHLRFIEAVKDPAKHDYLKKENQNALLAERNPIRLQAAREQYDVIKRM